MYLFLHFPLFSLPYQLTIPIYSFHSSARQIFLVFHSPANTQEQPNNFCLQSLPPNCPFLPPIVFSVQMLLLSPWIPPLQLPPQAPFTTLVQT